jgi:hypothetical protein
LAPPGGSGTAASSSIIDSRIRADAVFDGEEASLNRQWGQLTHNRDDKQRTSGKRWFKVKNEVFLLHFS